MAKSAFGTFIQIGDGGGTENFTTVFEVKDIKGPKLGLDTTEVTNMSSPGGWEEVIPTILRSGEVTFDVNYTPLTSTHNATTGILADMKNKVKRNWKLVFSDGASTTWAFAAFVTGFEPDLPVAGAIGASVTLKLTGQPTLV